LVDCGNYTCAQVEALAREHAREIGRKVSDLEKLKRAFETMSSQCNGDTLPPLPDHRRAVRSPRAAPDPQHRA
jgi:MerR family transcriptional regulator, mercuric resistance operon regulatory protein